jgi:hypothetical protein
MKKDIAIKIRAKNVFMAFLLIKGEARRKIFDKNGFSGGEL